MCLKSNMKMDDAKSSGVARVTYVVPVYNTEAFISRCVISLMEQTYYNIDFVFVDNASTDKSLDVLRQVITEYPSRRSDVRIITNRENKGSATARNQGLDAAVGDYVMFADSDDYVEADYVESLVAEAEKNDADIVYCNYYETYEKSGDKLINQNCGTDSIGCICSMLTGKMHGSTCNKLYRRKFLLQTSQWFIDGADLYEDVSWNLRLMAFKPKVAFLQKAFYYYVRYNSGSITQSVVTPAFNRVRYMQRIKNIDMACKFLDAKGLMKIGDVSRKSSEWKLMTKNDLIQDDIYSLKRWIVTFPEADKEIWTCNGLSINYRLLLTWLHFRWIGVYELQKKLLIKLNNLLKVI